MPCPVALVPWQRAHFEAYASDSPEEACPLEPDDDDDFVPGSSSELLLHPVASEVIAIAATGGANE